MSIPGLEGFLKLEEFLRHKPLFYAEIDYTRMPKVWKSIQSHFVLPKIIHLVGTNGKGSTGRFLSHALYKKGFKVGHYSSPHILKFNERIWLDGEDVSDARLEEAHIKLYLYLSESFRDSLSYFEYTTLLAMLVYEGCDYVVFEAGLGGEYDATAVFDNLLTLVTPIDMDHIDFLGEDISTIARTKLNAIQTFAILAKQPQKEVYQVAQKLAISKGVEIFRVAQFFTQEEVLGMETFIKSKRFPLFLANNLMLAMSAMKYLGLELNLDDLKDIVLFGRCQKISAHVTLDVGHNALAAKALLSHFQDQKVHLIFNSFADKNYEETLQILKPAIQIIEIIPILNERIEKIDNLTKVIEKLEIPYKMFDGVQEEIDYLVFGSFTVVETFLKKYG